MGKNRHKSNHNSRPSIPAPTAAPARLVPAEPTPVQIERLDALESEVQELDGQYGAPEPSASITPAYSTLAECLKRSEELLRSIRGHDERASVRESRTDGLLKNAEAQASAQVTSAAQKRRELEAEIAERKLQLDTELSEARQRIASEEYELRARVEQVDARELNLRERESLHESRLASLAEQSARLVERELNAEQGFITEKQRILRPVEDEVKRLREDRDLLEKEVIETRTRVEAEIRQSARARADRWAQEDAERTRAEAELRRRFDEVVVQERQQKLEALRMQLAAERKAAEDRWQMELERQRTALEQREADLAGREAILTSRLNAQRCAELDLRTAQEILAEDRAGQERKVERFVAERTEELRHEIAALSSQLAQARVQRDKYCREIESRRELDRRFGDRTPDEILAALTTAESARDTYAQQLRERPDARTAERLAGIERERSAWLEEHALLTGDLARLSGELARRRHAAIELETLTKQNEALDTQKKLLDGALAELQTRVDDLTRQDDHRNPMTALTSIDAKEEFQLEARTTTPLGKSMPTLQDFAIDLRHRIATGVEGRTLYYADRDVRSFLGGLAMTRFMLLQGISGTGKTSLPLAFHRAVGGDIEIVEVQAGWRDRQDLIGYYNAFHRHYYATNFLQALYRAGTPACRDRLFLIVLDEINLSRPEQFFADFLSALEQPQEQRRLTLVNDPVSEAPRLMVDGRHLPIPPNVWFIGTANHDESTAEFADKTYDRAHVMEMPRKTEAAHFEIAMKATRSPISYRGLEELFETASRNKGLEVQKATRWLREEPFAADLQRRFRVGWGNRLEQQLARYLPVVVESGGTVGEAMDHLLVTKVLRKLKDRHDVRVAALETLRIQLETSWETLDAESLPERSVALIESEIEAKKGEEVS